MKSKAVPLEQIYQAQLSEIGRLLVDARKSQGCTLQLASERTLIRASLLQAIETGQLDLLPEPVYVRGFIRRYAMFLGLDGENLANQLFAPANSRRRPSWKESPAAQLRPLHLYLAYVFVMIAAVTSLSYLMRRTAPEFSALPPLAPLTKSNSGINLDRTPSTDGAVAVVSHHASVSPVDDSNIRVEMTLTAQSWLRVISDGETEFEGILQPGESRQWKADKNLTIRAGNAGGVYLSYNDGKAQLLGEPGMVTEVTFPSQEFVGLAIP